MQAAGSNPADPRPVVAIPATPLAAGTYWVSIQSETSPYYWLGRSVQSGNEFKRYSGGSWSAFTGYAGHDLEFTLHGSVGIP